MKKFYLGVFLALLLLHSVSVLALIEQHPELDAAFTMIEKGNIFLERYNAITGANVQPLYEYGLPYFFGGQNPDYLMKIRKPFETTRYYSPKRSYIYGFDCSGYTKWINIQVGKPEHDSLSRMILRYEQYKNNHLPIKDLPYDQLRDHLIVGDFLVAKIRARHIMMYIGTLADYGFTEMSAPELKDYLNYPLVIHDGANPFYPERYEKYIAEKGLNATTTHGGVCVSIIGVPAEAMPYSVLSNEETYLYFNLEGYQLTLYDLNRATSYVWFRM